MRNVVMVFITECGVFVNEMFMWSKFTGSKILKNGPTCSNMSLKSMKTLHLFMTLCMFINKLTASPHTKFYGQILKNYENDWQKRLSRGGYPICEILKLEVSWIPFCSSYSPYSNNKVFWSTKFGGCGLMEVVIVIKRHPKKNKLEPGT